MKSTARVPSEATSDMTRTIANFRLKTEKSIQVNDDHFSVSPRSVKTVVKHFSFGCGGSRSRSIRDSTGSCRGVPCGRPAVRIRSRISERASTRDAPTRNSNSDFDCVKPRGLARTSSLRFFAFQLRAARPAVSTVAHSIAETEISHWSKPRDCRI